MYIIGMYHRPNAGNIYRPQRRDILRNLSWRAILKYAPIQSHTGNTANNTTSLIIVIMISLSVCMIFDFIVLYTWFVDHGGNYANNRRRGF